MKYEKDDYEDTDDQVDNQLELFKYATKVLSRGVKKDITPDFIMAKFNNPKDKEAIIEITNNAYFTKRTLNLLTKSKKWKYNHEQKRWERYNLTEKEKTQITDITDRMFDTFLTRMIMTALLNRNVKKNHILRLIAGLDTEEDENKTNETEEKEETRLQRTINKIMGKKQAEEEEA